MTTQRVTVRAPAKINWTLEVLSKRADGYHEIRSVMQTIDLCDELSIEVANELTLTVDDNSSALSNDPPDANLAYRAALALREHAGYRHGAAIRLSKHIPVAAGLGGGSSDAAATLRGLRALWELDISDEELAGLGAQLGSDVPFFLRGGTAIASGRGEIVEPLPDAQAQEVEIAPPPLRVVVDKTARMYAALRPEHYTDGSHTERLVERIRSGEPVRAEDCFNVFEQVLAEVEPEAAAQFDSARDSGHNPHLCGSGPAYFEFKKYGARTLSASDATAVGKEVHLG